MTFPTNVPLLCAQCHRMGQKAAVRYTGSEKEIVERYTESTHGKGLLKSGLVVTAMCTNCHTAHRELPHDNPESSVNDKNIPATCGTCHNGIEDQFEHSVHSRNVTKSDKPLPVCNDCHSAHTIQRTDNEGFKLTIMTQCGRCHEKIAQTYFDTYHGKVSQLGYTKTAKCYDCHGAHDILPIADPRSHLSRANVVATCQKCHPGATRRFAGYLTHATHHDPAKYPWLFWTFWGMTGLLVGTFTLGGAHTLMWLPRALQMRRASSRAHVASAATEFVRFTRLNRLLHAAMIVSFMSLALTGLTLKFSYTTWASMVSHLLGGYRSGGLHSPGGGRPDGRHLHHPHHGPRAAQAAGIRLLAQDALGTGHHAADPQGPRLISSARSSGSSGGENARVSDGGPTGRNSTILRYSGGLL